MKNISISALFLLCLTYLTACSQQATFDQRAENLGLEFVADMPLAGGTMRFDYQWVDGSKRRLYIAHMGSDMVTVYDIDSRKVLRDIPGTPNVHGVIAVPQLQRVYATATGEDQVAIIDENSLEIITKVSVGEYPDGLAYAPVQKRVFVSDEHGETVSVIDAINNNLLKKIEIGGEVGNTHYDSVSGLIYSADQSNNQLVAIDPDEMKIKRRYDLPGCRGAHGFYIDQLMHYALITGEDNAAFIALDLTSGEIIKKDKVGRSPDVLAFDSQNHLLFVASESGTVSVFNVQRGNIRKTGEAFFYSGAHTVSIDPKSHLVFFPLRNLDGRPVLRIMRLV